MGPAGRTLGSVRLLRRLPPQLPFSFLTRPSWILLHVLLGIYCLLSRGIEKKFIFYHVFVLTTDIFPNS